MLNNCTGNCLNCKEHLANIFARAREVPDPRDFMGVLVWAIRAETSDIGEAQEAEPAVPITNEWGERVEANPFDLFVRSL